MKEKRYINEPLGFTEESVDIVLKKEEEQKKKRKAKKEEGGNKNE